MTYQQLKTRGRRVRGKYRRLKRRLFLSPAEVRFIEVMGGKCTKLVWMQPSFIQFPPVIVWTLGRTLRRQKFKREVFIGRHCTDFCNDLFWIIEVDGAGFHDIIADIHRDETIRENLAWRGIEPRFLRIKAAHLWRDPAGVRANVERFLGAK